MKTLIYPTEKGKKLRDVKTGEVFSRINYLSEMGRFVFMRVWTRTEDFHAIRLDGYAKENGGDGDNPGNLWVWSLDDSGDEVVRVYDPTLILEP
jgi:hypothetical protein